MEEQETSPAHSQEGLRTAAIALVVVALVAVAIEVVVTVGAARWLITLGLLALAGWLVARRREEGVALLLVFAVMSALPLIVRGRATFVTWRDDLLVGGATQVLTEVVTVMGPAAMVAAGVIAWRLRDPEQWRRARAVPSWYVVLALAGVVAGSPIVFMVTEFGVDLVPVLILLVVPVTAALLIVAAMLPPRIAGAVVVAVALPAALDAVQVALVPMMRVAWVPASIPWMGAVALVVLVVVGAHWWRTSSSSGPVTDHQPWSSGRPSS